jgi:hypothetical protein
VLLLVMIDDEFGGIIRRVDANDVEPFGKTLAYPAQLLHISTVEPRSNSHCLGIVERHPRSHHWVITAGAQTFTQKAETFQNDNHCHSYS